MSRICPHCNYARQVSDHAPDWQCPSCQRAYDKAGTPLPPAGFQQYGPAVAERRGGAGKWMLLVLAFAFAAWVGHSLTQSRGVPVVAVAGASQPEVQLYATSWCGYCKATREFFAANGIRYTEHDIEQSSAAYNEHKKLGGHGVPLIVVGDQIINGYDERALRQILKPWLKG